jgi:hypothetical protein
MHLSWNPRDGARRYRVEILAADRSEVLQRHLVAAAELELDDQDLPAGARWRVQCSADGQWWEPHVPIVALPRTPTGLVTRVDWEPTGAVAYRLLVRDDELGEVVVKAPVIGPPAHVPWDELSAGHPHRMRVQEWRDGAWANLERYRPVAPPPHRGLHADPAELDVPTVHHAVLVRLSGLPAAGDHGERRPPEWLAQRLALMREWTLPALAATLRESDAALVVCDADVPADQLQALRESDTGAFGADEQGALAAELAGVASGAEWLAVTEMTAGDRPHPALWRRIHEHAAELAGRNRARCLVTFEQAARLDRDRDLAAIERYPSALLHTVLFRTSEPQIAEQALDRAGPFVLSGYRRTSDVSIVAVLRAWPGPNALSALHGPPGVPVDADEVRAAFDLQRSRQPEAASARV